VSFLRMQVLWDAVLFCCFIGWIVPDILVEHRASFARIRKFQTSWVPLAQQHSIIFQKI